MSVSCPAEPRMTPGSCARRPFARRRIDDLLAAAEPTRAREELYLPACRTSYLTKPAPRGNPIQKLSTRSDDPRAIRLDHLPSVPLRRARPIAGAREMDPASRKWASARENSTLDERRRRHARYRELRRDRPAMRSCCTRSPRSRLSIDSASPAGTRTAEGRLASRRRTSPCV